jgi:hypothetical protein
MVGRITTKGDRALRSNIARRLFSLNGSGISIGVISDSFDAKHKAAIDVATGDLPGPQNPNGYKLPVRVLKDTSRGDDEGRAILQIVHDIAPGARLLFSTVSNATESAFAKAVRSLANAGADIILDDLGIPTTLFQDGILASTITHLVNRGILYFSAIGNDDSRSYQSSFRAGATFSYGGVQYEAHDFDASTGVDLFQDIERFQDAPIDLLLGWDQPNGNVTTDLELFLVDRPQLPGQGGTVLATATAPAQQMQNPLKELDYEASFGRSLYLVIARRLTQPDSPAPSLFQWISTANDADSLNRYQYVNDGSGGGATVYGQPNARGAIAIGAIPVRQTPAFGGKMPQVETFSSRGGTPILFDSQGNRLPVPEVRQKPELVAPDRVSTTVSGFDWFSGTSAAVPHAAAVAALMLQRAGGRRKLTPAQVLVALQSTAIALGPSGNFSSGAGLVRADAAVLQSFRSKTSGTRHRDRIQGKAGANNLYGLSGNDRISGAAGYDAIFGGNGNDQLSGNAGNDYIQGGAGYDTLLGNSGADYLVGGSGRDTLIGDDGNDRLDGGTGKNLLLGGQGSDRFILNLNGFAIIQDFQPDYDTLKLPANVTVAQLNLVRQSGNTLVQFHAQTLAKLNGIAPNELAETQPFQGMS